MLFPVLKSIHFLSLYVFLGGPAFTFLIWRPAVGEQLPSETSALQKNVTVGLIAGGLLFVASGLADVLRAAYEVIGLDDVGMVMLFLRTSRIGRLTLVKIVMALAAIILWNVTGKRPSRLFVAVAAAVSSGLLVVVSLLSHAAGKAGLIPIVSDVIHLLVSILWAGGLLFFATLPWRKLRRMSINDGSVLCSLVERFSNVALAAVALVAATGGFASYLHVYTPQALLKTNYGQVLVVKIALFVVVLAVAAVNLLFISPAMRRAGQSMQHALFQKNIVRLSRSVRVEAIVLIALLVAVGIMTTLPPADSFNEVKQGETKLQVGDYVATVEMSPQGSPGEVQVDLWLRDGEGMPEGEEARVTFDFDMVAHSMGLRPMEGERVGPGHFRAIPLISMAGRWKADVHIAFPDGRSETTTFEFEAVEGARSIGQERRFDVRAVFFEIVEAQSLRPVDDTGGMDWGAIVRDFIFSSDGRPMNFAAGLIWLGASIYVVVSSRRNGLPRWLTPPGMIGIGIGTYLLFASLLVDAYPTQYVRNPIPLTAESVAAGKGLYDAHCSYCHGSEGFGDGEMAPFLDPPPEDLRARHVDLHPDGELFWWLSHGIAGTAMPGTKDVLTDEERWHIVNFVRSFHRDIVH